MAVRALAVALTAVLLGSASAHADPGSADPWGPYGWDAQHGRFHQPQLATPTPRSEPLGSYDNGDFDGDGVRNADDNCLLVPNPDQRPARKPQTQQERQTYGSKFGPGDMLYLSSKWKKENPTGRFRDDSELGEACSGYNKNYLRTTRAFARAGDKKKMEIFRFLGQSGPMMGGAANPFPKGKPTSYDHFGTLPGPLTPSPTPQSALARNADGTRATGNMTPSMPMCSGFDEYAGFFRWLTGANKLAPGAVDAMMPRLRAAYQRTEKQIGCNSKTGVAGESAMMHAFWAGKRLYTNEDGGRITNRFVSAVTENPVVDAILYQEPLRTMAKAVGLIPNADDPTASGQSRQGIIFRGKSYVDGNDTIMMDWRGFEGAWPLGEGKMLGNNGNLIYDECRAIQTGVYACTAVLDVKIGKRRHTFQEGYMPWVVKGPPSINEYIAAVN